MSRDELSSPEFASKNKVRKTAPNSSYETKKYRVSKRLSFDDLESAYNSSDVTQQFPAN